MRAIRRPLSEGRSGRSHPLNCTIASRNLDFSDVYLRAINTKFRSIGVPCLLIFLSLAKNCEGQHDVAICMLSTCYCRSFLADGERNDSDWSRYTVLLSSGMHCAPTKKGAPRFKAILIMRLAHRQTPLLIIPGIFSAGVSSALSKSTNLRCDSLTCTSISS